MIPKKILLQNAVAVAVPLRYRNSYWIGLQMLLGALGQQVLLTQNDSMPPLIAGVDEVGRGALFGPVVAAAVILSDQALTTLTAAGVRDSKQLTPKARTRLADEIRAIALDCQVAVASVREIDRLNILQATLLAMKRSILKLQPPPDLCLIDGNQRIRDLLIPQQTLIKGDQTSTAIASASIVAKVWRDELIVRLADKYPEYDLIHNKGYGTKKHRQALQRYGPCSQHRLSFTPCQLSIPLDLSLS